MRRTRRATTTLDGGVHVRVKRYLAGPVHHVETAHSPVATMTHHVLHVGREHRIDVSPTSARTIRADGWALTPELGQGWDYLDTGWDYTADGSIGAVPVS